MERKRRRLQLEGILGEEFCKEFEAMVRSPSDFFDCLNANFPTFKSRILDLDRQGYRYRLTAGDRVLLEDDVTSPISDDLLLVPVMVQGDGKLLGIVSGLGLLGVGLLTGGTALALSGGAMALNGIAAIIAPPKLKRSAGEADKPNIIISGIRNTQGLNGYVPIVYGMNVYTGGRLVSGQIVASYSADPDEDDSI